MSSLAPDHSSRRDAGRKRKPVEPVVSDVESGVEDQEELAYSQPRASHHPKRTQKPQKPTGHIILEINGDVTIKRDLILSPERGDNRRRPRSPPPLAQSSTQRLRPTKSRRRTTQCDSPTDLPTDSDEEPSSYSEDSAPQSAPSRRPTRSMASPKHPPTQSDRRTKRYQPDEGYHTSGTASYTAEVNKQSGKGKEKSVPLGPSSNSSRHARLPSSTKHRKSKTTESENDATSHQPDADEGSEGPAEDNNEIDGEEEDDDDDDDEDQDEDDEDASDDDFGKIRIQICGAGSHDTKAIDEKAVLDTGTRPDWISHNFYQKLRKMGIKSVKLNPEEQKWKYRDFNGKQFSPTSKVDLMVQSDEFEGTIKCRVLSFFIASNATFSVLIGRDTIRKHELMIRGKRDTNGEGVLVGVLGKCPEAEKAEMKRKKEERDKLKQERAKLREEKIEATRQKDTVKPSSSQVAAHLATAVSRGSRTRSPPRSVKGAPKQLERRSNSSLEGAW